MQHKYLLFALLFQIFHLPYKIFTFIKPLLLIAGLFISSLVIAQEKNESSRPGQMSFYAEFWGPGILFSANFDT